MNDWHTSRELWWGESRPLPVQENTLLYSWSRRMGGDFFKKIAADRGVPLDRVIPELGSPGENEGFEILRPVFERHQTMLDAVKPQIVVGPGVWVLTASLENAIKHLGALEKFTTDLSDELEGSQGPCFRGCPIRSVPSMPTSMVSRKEGT